MGLSLTERILSTNLVDGSLEPGEEIGIQIDQVLAPDTSGTMVWLQFEALGLDSVQIDPVVQYCDHQTYQFNFRNTDDHRFLRSAAGTYGAYYSRAGNGICHQVHKERFTAPGTILLGSDSHTPTGGGFGQLAIGAGGLDIAIALGGGPYYFEMPEIVNVYLEGELGPWTTGKDVILHLLDRLSVSGGVGKIFEFSGPGVVTLSAPERTTITNMCTELGATTGIFPSDEQTLDYLDRLGRAADFVELRPDPDATYDDKLTVDLSSLEPLIALPSMPDRVVPVREVAGTDVQQVIVGSCTNGSYEDILPIAKMLTGRTVDKRVEMIIAPGSKQASEMLVRRGYMAELLASGVNVSEATCGACIGIGHVPGSDTVSLRTFNRNFEGRSGIEDDAVYLCSPEVAAAAALTGEITDPRGIPDRYPGVVAPGVELPERYDCSRAGIIAPDEAVDETLIKGPNIGSVPLKEPLGERLRGEVILKMGANVTTDHIIPGRSDILMYRSNIAKLSEFTLSRIDETVAERARAVGGGVLVAGDNYGQGSSREHAALCPMYLGIDAVFAISFARIHEANLINFGIVPFTIDEDTYDQIEQGDHIQLTASVSEAILAGVDSFPIQVADEWSGSAMLNASQRERAILVAGGRLPYTKRQAEQAT